MEDLRISLIIPAYNEEKYIGSCLDYIKKNADKKFHEIIVVDNASTDNTREVVSKYPGIKIVNEKRKGITFARQKGFEESSGDVLAYIDADTRLPQGWFEAVDFEFKKNPETVCVGGPFLYYDLSSFKQVFVKLYWYILAMPVYFLVGYMPAGPNFAIRRETLEKMSGFNTSIQFYGEDTDIVRRAHHFGKMKFKPDLVMYASARRLKNQGALYTTLIYIINFCSEVILHRPFNQDYKDFR